MYILGGGYGVGDALAAMVCLGDTMAAYMHWIPYPTYLFLHVEKDPNFEPFLFMYTPEHLVHLYDTKATMNLFLYPWDIHTRRIQS